MHQNVIQGGVQIQIIHFPSGLHEQPVDDVYRLLNGCSRSWIQILGSFKSVLAVGCALPDKLLSSLAALRALRSGACNGHVVFLRPGIQWDHILCKKFRADHLLSFKIKRARTDRNRYALALWLLHIFKY